jgi:hypothetical protein
LKRLFCLFLICHCYAFSQEDNLPKGKIIDTIFVDQNLRESFSLYLPDRYNPSEISPIVFIFDPAARGRIGIKPFIKSSEEYGHILVCSNNSKNGPYEQNLAIVERLFNKVLSEFNIDEKRIYTAGFSGGSRLASKIAILTKQIQGVIACGAGFASKLDLLGQDFSFSYAAIVGDEDMNYREMYTNKDYLNKLNINNELFINENNHRWPSQNQVQKAFDWLQLEAYRKGVITTNKKIINKIYLNYYKNAIELNKENKQLYSLYEYERIIKNFKRYYHLDSINSTIKELEKNKFLKKEKKNHNSILEEEKTLTKVYSERFTSDFNKTNRNLKWWNSEITKLKRKIEKTDTVEKKMLNRVLYIIFAKAIESVQFNGVQNIDQAIFCYDICIIIYPEYPLPYFKQIENFINKNNESIALDYLEKLLNSGYNDINSIKENNAVKRLKNTDRYLQLITN